MRIKTTCIQIFIFILFLNNKSYSQHIIKGIVIDSLTEQPISYAIIKISKISSVANSEGKFSVIYNKKLPTDFLTITSLGYKPIIIKLNPVEDSIYRLVKQDIILAEVVVTPFSIHDLLKSATAKSSTRFSKPAILEGYYREVVKRDSLITKYSDGMVNFYLEKSKNGKTAVSTQVDQSRVKEIDLRDEDEKYNGLNNKIEISYLPEFIQPLKASILDSSYYKYYSYKLTEIDGEKTIYKIDFKPLLNTNIVLNEGSIYIDKETNLILALDYRFSPTSNFKYVKSFSVFGITLNITGRNTFIKYQISGNNYYPIYMTTNMQMEFQSKDLSQKNEFNCEFITAEYKNEGVIKTSKIFKKKYLYQNGNSYSYDFWESSNINPNTTQVLNFLKD